MMGQTEEEKTTTMKHVKELQSTVRSIMKKIDVVDYNVNMFWKAVHNFKTTLRWHEKRYGSLDKWQRGAI